ncbi:MAG: B12-binding domain-containing radical SAM protein [Nitrospirota bacterium]
MKILLITPLCQPSLWENEISSRWPSLGLCYIASVLKREGYEVSIFERRRIIDRNRRTEENLRALDKETIRYIKSFNPSFIGITATTPLIMDAYRVARLIKEGYPSIRIMVGGCHPTAEPVRTLKDCPEIDAVCIGEGEFTFLDFVRGLPLQEINGIAYREDNKIKLTPKREFYKDIDTIPFPARELLDRDYYFSPQGMTMRGYYLRATTLLAARGCPFRCAFCQSGQLSKVGTGKYVRFHSPKLVIEEIKQLIKEFDINGLLFAEDMFSIKKDNVNAICELMIKEGIHKKIKWAANLRVDAVDRELFKIMKEAGCIQIVYGCESGSQRTLDRLQKRTTVEMNYEAIRLAKEEGITVESNIMIGLPGETEDDFQETIEFLKNSRPDRINRGKLYPLPGTPIYEELLKAGEIREIKNWNDIWDRYVATELTFADISPRRFAMLQAKMDRTVVYPINYICKIKNNLKIYPMMALRQAVLMVVHCSVLYLPLSFQRFARRIAGLLRIQSKYVAE